MRSSDFMLLFEAHTMLYLTIWVVTFAFYRLLFWQTVKSIFDPLYISIIFTNSICTVDVIFLSILGDIRSYFTYSYLLSEFSLLLGMLIYSARQPIIASNPFSELFIRRLDFGMKITFVLFISLTFVIYFERGIPLLMVSRAEASSGGSGFGILTRITQVANILFVLFYFVKRKGYKLSVSKIENSMLLIMIFINLLSGFKAFFLIYLFGYFITNGRELISTRKRDFYIILLGALVIFGLFSFIYDSTDIDYVFMQFISRLVSSGDVYFMSYANDMIYSLPDQNFFFQHFGALLASFQIISWDSAPLNYGYAINELINNNDALVGPTFRFNVLWLLLTDNLLITALLSFMLGIIIGKLRQVIYSRNEMNFNFIFLAFIYNYSFILVLGPEHAINTIFLGLPILIFFYASIFIVVKKRIS